MYATLNLVIRRLLLVLPLLTLPFTFACSSAHADDAASVFTSPAMGGQTLPSGSPATTDVGSSPTATSPSGVVTDPNDVGQDYVLGPGDEFDVTVNPQADYSVARIVVGQDGNIDYPKVGEIPVGGKTREDAKQIIISKLSDYCKNPLVSISMEALRPQVVYVTGGVPSAHILDVRAASNVAKAVTLSGGATDRNELMNVAVLRGDQVLHSNVYPILVNGNMADANNLKLEAGDVVVVPVNTLKFAISGGISRPGVYPLTQVAGSNEGAFRLSDAIFAAGGTNNGSNLGSVRVIRHDAAGKPIKKTYDYGKALQGDDSQNPVIEDKDIIYVPQKSSHLDPFQIPAFVYLFRFFGGL